MWDYSMRLIQRSLYQEKVIEKVFNKDIISSWRSIDSGFLTTQTI